jgi:hypothetical protein
LTLALVETTRRAGVQDGGEADPTPSKRRIPLPRLPNNRR